MMAVDHFNRADTDENDQFDPSDFYLGASSPVLELHQCDDISHRDDDENASGTSTLAAELLSPTHDDHNVHDSIREFDNDSLQPEFITLGSIRLRNHPLSTTFVICSTNQPWQPIPVRNLADRGLLRCHLIPHQSLPDHAVARLYLLSEDIRKSPNESSLNDRRRYIRALLPFIDTCQNTWNGQFDPFTPPPTYLDPSSYPESLFHIFNTLPSPSAVDSYPEFLHLLGDARQALWTQLYPYQERSVVAMLQREMKPRKSIDPRKPHHIDMLDRDFYLDIHEGIILRQPQLYEESRGGVLAETMGYGKTAIALALICSTRGHFPSVPEGRLDVKPPIRDKVPTLLETAAVSAGRNGIPWKSEFQTNGMVHQRCIDELKRHYRRYVEPIFTPANPGRKGKRVSEKIVRVCWTTLIVVPQNLLIQWQHEIQRHIKAGALDVLVIDSKQPIPSSSILAENDVVLISKSRLEAEYRDDDLHNGKIRRGEASIQSPLTELRWLRVIYDEGHAFAGSATRTNALAMLDKMYIERRWVVSGTPSDSLVGVEVGIATDTSDTPRAAKIDQSLQSKRVAQAAEEEMRDVDKLRHLVTTFLKMPPWANRKGIDHAGWKKYLAPFDGHGQRRKTACLRTLLQSLVVRHRIQDIDADLHLPPLINRTIYLEPSYHDKLSLNLFTMVLTANAVTSERTDEDYLFHSRNRKTLDVLVKNLRQSSFHWVGFKPEHLIETLKTCKKYLDEHLDSISDEDGLLITEAILNGERALSDEEWLAFSKYHEIGVYASSFPSASASAWSLHGQTSEPLLLGAGQGRAAQRWVDEHLYDPTAGLTGAGLRQMQAVQKRSEDEANKSTRDVNMTNEPTLKGQSSSEVSSPKRKRSSLSSVGSLSTNSPLMKTEIIGFSSAKLAYLADQVLQYHTEEKIIIFYDVGNIAFWIAEALDLVSIKYLIYASTLTVARRASYLATFNESNEFRVFLMDLGQAALGLHVACASRVYIVSPIWQPNIESQAVKRAHRIGQTRPVHIETLVLRGTLEDKMLSRRRQMSDGELKKASKNLLDDEEMSQMIKEQRFLHFEASEDSDSNQSARLKRPQSMFGKLLQKTSGPEEGLVLVAGDQMALPKKQKTVRIATP